MDAARARNLVHGNGHTARHGVTKFSDMSKDEFHRFISGASPAHHMDRLDFVLILSVDSRLIFYRNRVMRRDATGGVPPQRDYCSHAPKPYNCTFVDPTMPLSFDWYACERSFSCLVSQALSQAQ
jgi:hypothetical protein